MIAISEVAVTNYGIAHTDLEWTTVSDAKSSRFQLSGGSTKKATGYFGEIYSSIYNGEGFVIDLSSFQLKQALVYNIDTSNVFYLVSSLQQTVVVGSIGGDSVRLSPEQFEGFYCPDQKICVALEAGIHQIVSLSFKTDFLSSYSKHCNRLATFLENSVGLTPARMLDSQQFMSVDCRSIIQKIIGHSASPAFAGLYYAGLVQEMMTLLCIRLQLVTGVASFSSADIEAAGLVKSIIIGDFEIFPTLEQLVKKTGVSKLRLQRAFKHLYGQTIGTFSRAARLERGYELLHSTTYPLRVVCEMVGYPDPANFSTAFKKQYGCWPGQVQREAAKNSYEQQQKS